MLVTACMLCSAPRSASATVAMGPRPHTDRSRTTPPASGPCSGITGFHGLPAERGLPVSRLTAIPVGLASRTSTTVPPSWPILEDAQTGQRGLIPRCLPPLMIRRQHARHEPEDSGRLDDLGPAGGQPLPATVQYLAIVACAGAEMPLCQRKHGTSGSCDRRFAVCGPRFGCTVRSQFSRARQRPPTRRARRYG